MLVLSREVDQSIVIQTDLDKVLDPFQRDSVKKAIADVENMTPDELRCLANAVYKLLAHAAEPVKVMVVDIRGYKVRLGTHAAPAFDVDREEVALERQRDARAAKKANSIKV